MWKNIVESGRPQTTLLYVTVEQIFKCDINKTGHLRVT